MIASTFNRRFAENRQMTVSKTFVNEVTRKHYYEIQVLRREIKNRKPKGTPRNLIWGMDLTGKADANGNVHNLLGIVEHKSRLNLNLAVLKDKGSITILRLLLDAVERYDKPKFLRTDNEPVFRAVQIRIMVYRHPPPTNREGLSLAERESRTVLRHTEREAGPMAGE